MKKKILIISGIVVLVVILSFLVQIFVIKPNRSYKELWALYNKFEYGNSQIIDLIYNQAKKDHNNKQVIKTYFAELINENNDSTSILKTIDKLKKDIEEIDFPDKAFLYFELGKYYEYYFKKIRLENYDFGDNSNVNDSNISTCNYKKIKQLILNNYYAALSNPESTLNTQAVNYENVIKYCSYERGYSEDFVKYSLYNFLANQIKESLSYSVFNSSKFTDDYFNINTPELYTNYENFKIKSEKKDSISFKYHEIKVLLNLVQTKNKNINASISEELNYLNFINNNYLIPDNDSLFLNTLYKLKYKYKFKYNNFDIQIQILDYYISRSEENIIYLKKNKSYKKKALNICNEILKNYTTKKIKEKCTLIRKEITKKYLNFEIEEAVPINQNFTSLIRYANITNLHVSIYKIDSKIKKRNFENGFDDFNKFQKRSKIIQKFSIKLPYFEDFNTHSTEIAFKGLSSGAYIIKIDGNDIKNSNDTVSEFCFIDVSDIVFAETNDYLKYKLFNRKTGKPYANVNVQTWNNVLLEKSKETIKIKGFSYKSDIDGNVWLNKRDILCSNIDLKFENDFFEIGRRFPSPNYEVEDKTVINIFTDKAIYRPGQIVNFSGIVLKYIKENPVIIPNFKTNISFNDYRTNILSEINVKSNEFGTFKGQFTIPNDILLGEYSIYSEFGETSIKVEEYKKPTFYIAFLPQKKSYVLFDSITVEGFAKTFSGVPLSNANLNIRVNKSDFPDYFDNSDLIKSNNIKTDRFGKFSYIFQALPDNTNSAQNNSNYYQIIAEITDIQGETHSTSTNLRIDINPFFLDCDIPENLQKEKCKKFNITATNSTDNKFNVDFNIKIFEIEDNSDWLKTRKWNLPETMIYSKNEWNKLFPNSYYGNLGESNKQNKKLVYETNILKKENNKFDLQNISNLKSGKYTIEITAKDELNRKSNTSKDFTLFSPYETKTPYKTPFWVQTLRDTIEIGSVAQICVGTSFPEIYVIADIYKNRELIKSFPIIVKNEQLIISIPASEKLKGGFTINLHSIYNNNGYNETRIITIPYSNKKLKIKFASFRDKLFPGKMKFGKLKLLIYMEFLKNLK